MFIVLVWCMLLEVRGDFDPVQCRLWTLRSPMMFNNNIGNYSFRVFFCFNFVNIVHQFILFRPNKP